LVLCGVINKHFFKKEVNPEIYGWVKLYGNYYQGANGYVLYKSNVWVLDKMPKNAHGVIQRFGEKLDIIDIELANYLSVNILNPTRKLSNR
jgi:hypothetical protein